MMENLIQLQRKQVIDLRDARVDHHLGVLGNSHEPSRTWATNSLIKSLPPRGRSLHCQIGLARQFDPEDWILVSLLSWRKLAG